MEVLIKVLHLLLGNNIVFIAPLLILSLSGLFFMILGSSFNEKEQGSLKLSLSLMLFMLFMVFVGKQDHEIGKSYFYKLIQPSSYSFYFSILLVFAISFTSILIQKSSVALSRYKSDIFALLYFSASGLWLLVHTKDLLAMFVGLEVFSLPIYALASLPKHNKYSIEAGFKYFLIGSFSSAFFLMGIALHYAVTGNISLNYYISLARVVQISPLIIFSLSFLLFGLFLKLTLVPLHVWASDVYQGANNPTSAFLMTIAKTAILFVLIGLMIPLSSIAMEGREYWIGIVWLFAVLSMLFGNLLALKQKNLKRILTCSGITHAGYLTMTAISKTGIDQASNIFNYCLVYFSAIFGFLYVVSFLEEKLKIESSQMSLVDLKNLFQKNLILSLFFVLFIFSLAGLPPAFGAVFAKISIITTVLSSKFYGLVFVALLSSLIGIVLYFRIISTVFNDFQKQNSVAETIEKIKLSLWDSISLSICAFFIVFGIFFK